MIRLMLALCMLSATIAGSALAGDCRPGLVKGVRSEGRCAIINLDERQCRQLALQRARAAAIEQAACLRITSDRLVMDMRLAVDFIGTFSSGYIVREEPPEWSADFYQKEKTDVPITEYRVSLVSDVYLPDRAISPIGLSADILLDNKQGVRSFRAGDRVAISVRTEREARVAIFNIMADDRVVMLFPNRYELDNAVLRGESLVFPRAGSSVELELQTLKGHRRDAEAIFVVALDPGHERDLAAMFGNTPMPLSAFFNKYSTIADYTEDVVLPYEVMER